MVLRLADLIESRPETDPVELADQIEIERYLAHNEICGSIAQLMRELPDRAMIGRDGLGGIMTYSSDETATYLHADRLDVQIDHGWGTTRVERMVPEEDNLAGWVTSLMSRIETCWVPVEAE